jgi:glycosyltransferase involved in cell wall biosynthesis
MGDYLMVNQENNITVITPVFNEASGLDEFHVRLTEALDKTGLAWSILYVDDGSTDNTHQVLAGLAQQSRVGVLSLARNFGKESALIAGLDHCDADLVLMMDADLQHPPSLIPEMLERCAQGADMVSAVRSSRSDQALDKRLGAGFFYWLMGRMSDTDLPPDSSDFRLVNRQVADAFRSLRETHRFSKGLFAWLGFRQETIAYEPDPRFEGHSKWSTAKLVRFGLEGLTSFSIAPLKLATVLGFFVALGAFSFGLFIIVKTLLFGNPVPGFPTLIVVVLFMAGLQLLAIGMIGEYVGRIYQQAKHRPLYVVRGFRSVTPAAKDPKPEHQE